jgi:hypothetical protein
MSCTAIKKSDGLRCTYKAKQNGLCGKHLESAIVAGGAGAAVPQAAGGAGRTAAKKAAIDKEHEKMLEEYRRVRTRKYDADLAHAAQRNAMHTVRLAGDVLREWNLKRIAGYSIPKAYAILCYTDLTHEAIPALKTALVHFVYQTNNVVSPYLTLPTDERNRVLNQIRDEVARFGEIDEFALCDPYERGNPDWIQVQQRHARDLAFQEELRRRPVVFARDPKDGINLAALATDTQSVHRSSVQTETHKAVLALLARPVPEGMDAISEIIDAFAADVKWNTTESHETAMRVLLDDFMRTEAFSVKYADVLSRVWAYIRDSPHRKELCLRLAQEICEGHKMCSNGKMARLINTLRGFDETLETIAPREFFQARFAQLMKLPLAERRPAAEDLFKEFEIPADEQPVWLEPLLEVDDE